MSATARNRRLLWITFGLTASYLFVEVVGGLVTNSLALLADAAHMLTDVGGLGLALFAAWMSTKPANMGGNTTAMRRASGRFCHNSGSHGR